MNSLAGGSEGPSRRGTAASPRPAERLRAPLSFAQERLWLMERHGRLGPTCTIPLALRLEGALDVEGLEKSIELLVIRHESLRTRIRSVDGRGMQVIDPPGGYSLERVDLREAGVVQDTDGVRQWVQWEAARPFEVLGGALFRALLLHVSDREHVLLLCMHHMISDGGSVGILVDELSELYRAHAQGRTAALTELSMQYAEYAMWQREWLQGRESQRLLRYWRQQLTDLPATVDMPTDRQRPPTPSWRGERVGFHSSPQLSAELARLSRHENTTLFVTLAAALQVLLMKWSGQRDIAIGAPVAGRHRRELEGVIGFFADHVVLRAQVTSEESFRVLLGRMKDTVNGAYAHQDLPFVKIVQELQPERDLSRQPVFQVWLSLQSGSDEPIDFADLRVSRIGAESGTSQFDLSLLLVETAAQLSGAFEYATDLFERATIEHLARRFQALLQEIVVRPDIPIGQLAFLEAPEIDRNQRKEVDPEESVAAEMPEATAEYVAPRTPVEEGLARIWSEVLRIPRVGVQDNFFDLGGGHSILAMQMIARVREVFEVEIPIGMLFRAPDMEKFAACVIAASRTD